MTKRSARINLIFLIIAISAIAGFYFLRQQSPCNIDPVCLQCLKDVNCFVEGDCINKCAQKPECWGLNRCSNLSEILSENNDQSFGLVKSSKEEAITATSTETMTVPVGQKQFFEVGDQKYSIEIIELCYDCREGEGYFTIKINGELKEGLKYGDKINLDKDINLGIRKPLRESGSLVEFFVIQNIEPPKELTLWEKLINTIKNIFNNLYERFN